MAGPSAGGHRRLGTTSTTAYDDTAATATTAPAYEDDGVNNHHDGGDRGGHRYDYGGVGYGGSNDDIAEGRRRRPTRNGYRRGLPAAQGAPAAPATSAAAAAAGSCDDAGGGQRAGSGVGIGVSANLVVAGASDAGDVNSGDGGDHCGINIDHVGVCAGGQAEPMVVCGDTVMAVAHNEHAGDGLIAVGGYNNHGDTVSTRHGVDNSGQSGSSNRTPSGGISLGDVSNATNSDGSRLSFGPQPRDQFAALSASTVAVAAAISATTAAATTVGAVAASTTTTTAPANATTTKVAWRRREQQDAASTEGSLRALLNKLAPSSNSLGSLATQVASHLLEDEAPNELARQLVDRAQLEPIYAATYAKLCSVLVRVRSGFVFYKQLMTRCQSAFGQGVQTLIVEPMETCDDLGNSPNCQSLASCAAPNQHERPQHTQHSHRHHQQQQQQHHHSPLQQQQQQHQHHRQLLNPLLNPNQVSSSNGYDGYSFSGYGSSTNSANNNNTDNNYPSNADLQRHRLKALVEFLCHLFTEGLLGFDRLYDDYLRLLEVHLPDDDVAIECVCSALTCAGQALQRARPQWVLTTVHELQAALRPLHEQRKLRMIFMVQDLVEMHQRNWQPREASSLSSAPRMPRDQAEP